jgi:hypothetical protein
VNPFDTAPRASPRRVTRAAWKRAAFSVLGNGRGFLYLQSGKLYAKGIQA